MHNSWRDLYFNHGNHGKNGKKSQYKMIGMMVVSPLGGASTTFPCEQARRQKRHSHHQPLPEASSSSIVKTTKTLMLKTKTI